MSVHPLNLKSPARFFAEFSSYPNMSDLKLFQRKILRYILGDKRPRVNKLTLYTPKLREGLGVPDLTKYYQDAQLSQLIRFHTRQSRPLWMTIKSSHCPTREISHLIWLRAKDRPTMLCPELPFSLNLWDRLTTTYGFKSPHAPMAPLLGNPAFTPDLHPKGFTWWTNKGLLHIAYSCDHRGVLSKPFLQEKYQLPNSEVLLYTDSTLSCYST